MAQLGLRLNYDDFSMQDLRNMEYFYLQKKAHEKKEFFETLFEWFGKTYKNMLKTFKT